MDAFEPAVAGHDAGREERCPACAARCARGAPWCTLCFADLRPAVLPVPPVPVPVPPVPEARPVPAPGAGGTSGATGATGPADTPAGRHEPEDLLRREVAGRAPRIPVVTDLVAGPGGAVAVMLFGTAFVGGGAVALMWLVGLLL